MVNEQVISKEKIIVSTEKTIGRKAFLSVVELFVNYATENGSKNSKKYYMIFSKLIKNYPFKASSIIVMSKILEGIKNNTDYHLIYRNCKELLKKIMD